MKLLFTSLVVFLLAVVLALVAREDPGYIVINYQDWTVETSLVLAVVAVAIGFVLIYLLVRFLVNMGRVPDRLGHWGRRRQKRKANESLQQGLVALINGRWQEAERDLVKYMAVSETPLVNYLFAARAAEKQGAAERRDKYLELARGRMPQAETAIGLTRAELLIQHGKVDQALETLNQLRLRQDPGQEAVIRRLLSLYRDVQDWRRLLDLLPVARKHRILTLEKMRELQTLAYTELFNKAGFGHDIKMLHELWERMPKELRRQAGIINAYAHQLIKCKAPAEAERVLSYFLSKHWNDELAYLYGIVDADVLVQLSRAESWLKAHRDSSALLLTMGRLCKRNELWGKARQFFEASLSVDENPEALQELAGVLEQMGEHETALEFYRKGMLMKMPGTAQQLADQSAAAVQGSLVTTD